MCWLIVPHTKILSLQSYKIAKLAYALLYICLLYIHVQSHATLLMILPKYELSILTTKKGADFVRSIASYSNRPKSAPIWCQLNIALVSFYGKITMN